MENIDKYRIVEKDKFYPQKKSKIFGWHYIYDLEEQNFVTIAITFVLAIIGIVLCIFVKWWIIIPTTLDIVIFLLARFWIKQEKDTLQYAKDYILSEIERKEKLKIKKIHYLNIQAERKDKLNSLKAS